MSYLKRRSVDSESFKLLNMIQGMIYKNHRERLILDFSFLWLPVRNQLLRLQLCRLVLVEHVLRNWRNIKKSSRQPSARVKLLMYSISNESFDCHSITSQLEFFEGPSNVLNKFYLIWFETKNIRKLFRSQNIKKAIHHLLRRQVRWWKFSIFLLCFQAAFCIEMWAAAMLQVLRGNFFLSLALSMLMWIVVPPVCLFTREGSMSHLFVAYLA